MPFANLPGVQVNTVDGGLAARRTPRSKATVIIGTSDIGQAEDPYQVVDRGTAAKLFGITGTITRAVEEVGTFSDNIVIFRMGTKPMVLANVGLQCLASTAITLLARASGVVTVTSATHGLIAGDTARVSGCTIAALNGLFTVISAPTGNTITYAQAGADITSALPAGTPILQKVVTPGFTITFNERTSDAQTRYNIWYKAGIMYVWLDGSLVYANDVANSTVVDTGNIFLSLASITAQTGLQLGTTSTGSLGVSITVQAAAALGGAPTTPTPALTQPVTGTGLTGRQTYIALTKALDLLANFPVQQVYCPNVLLDDPNVAYYVASDSTSFNNNPVANANALDWLNTRSDAFGNKTYQWANDVVDDTGAVQTAMVAATPLLRIAAGFREVSSAYALANFCNNQAELQGGCVAILGVNGPTLGGATNAALSFKLADTRTWVGFLPVYDINNNATTAGKGLLGYPLMVGTSAAKLNSLCADIATGRLQGMYKTNEGQYDGTIVLDRNSNKVDIGSLLHIAADYGIMSNGWAANYAGNISGMVAGYLASLDEKSNLTNKALNIVQLWKPSPSQMDSLTAANVNVLRFKGLGVTPCLLHGETAASRNTDYNSLIRVRIRFMLVKQLLETADKFIGQSSIDGLQLTALQTALDGRCLELQKRGYISRYKFVVSTTDADQRIGHANIDVNFMPADELIQLNAYIGISRR